jgi:hypothetical protein
MLMFSCNLIPSSNVLSTSFRVVLVKVLLAHLAHRAQTQPFVTQTFKLKRERKIGRNVRLFLVSRVNPCVLVCMVTHWLVW